MFRPTCKDWPSQHRTLAFCLVAFLLVLFLAYLLFLRPLQGMLREKRNKVQEMQRQFDATRLPPNPLLLQEQLNTTRTQLDGAPDQEDLGLSQLSTETLDYATRAFAEKIHQNYPDAMAFFYGATRLDYKDLQERILTEFAQGDTPLAPEALGLEQKDAAQEAPIWQLIAKLWTIQEFLQKAREAGLQLTQENGEENSPLVQAAPIIGYTLQDSAEGSIYLMEFPVRGTFSGTMEQFQAFAGSLQTTGCFLPMTRLSIHTAPPDQLHPGEENTVETALFVIQCSAFMAPLDPLVSVPVEESPSAPQSQLEEGTP